MSEKNETRSRKCNVCDFYFPTTAREIKEHAVECEFKKQEKQKAIGQGKATVKGGPRG